jgi:hypothetical protein
MTKTLRFPAFVLVASVSAMVTGCATSISGRVVRPDGSALTNAEVKVYTAPKTSATRVDKDGSYKLSGEIIPDNEYTLIAEDREGNTGYVRGFKPKKGSNKDVIVRMSREMEAKDAVLEGNGPLETGAGPGEKILKSSQ